MSARQLLYVANVRLPSERANGIQIMKMCEAFAREGITVTLVLPRRRGRLDADPFEFYGVARTFTIRYVHVIDIMDVPGIPQRVAFWIRTLTFHHAAMRIVRRHPGSISYSREWFLVPQGGIYEMHKFPSRITRWHRSAWRKARLIVTITRALKNELIAVGVPTTKTVVAPDGVDVAMFGSAGGKEEARRRCGLPQDRPIIMYAGSLLPWKGVDVLLQAANVLHKSDAAEGQSARSSPSVVVVGGTKKQIQRLQRQYGNLPVVLLVGYRPHAEVPHWLAAADVVVVPNRSGDSASERHTSPLKLFEYMAAGRPIVASDLPSLREILDDRAAFLVPPDDPIALARGVSRALRNSAEADRRAREAQKRVERYGWDERARFIIGALHGTS